MNWPNILIVGPSGTGKSYAIENLLPEKTLVLNTERKFLPFKNALKFKDNNILIENKQQFDNELNKALLPTSPFENIVIESFSKYADMVETVAKGTNSGWEIWNFFNNQIGLTVEKIKKCGNKFVIVIMHDEFLQLTGDSGTAVTKRRAKIAGKKWEGMLEKEFSLVLYTGAKIELGSVKEAKYFFRTNTDGMNSAKSPAGMFEMEIPNDLNVVTSGIKKYYGF